MNLWVLQQQHINEQSEAQREEQEQQSELAGILASNGKLYTNIAR